MFATLHILHDIFSSPSPSLLSPAPDSERDVSRKKATLLGDITATLFPYSRFNFRQTPLTGKAQPGSNPFALKKAGSALPHHRIALNGRPIGRWPAREKSAPSTPCKSVGMVTTSSRRAGRVTNKTKLLIYRGSDKVELGNAETIVWDHETSSSSEATKHQHVGAKGVESGELLVSRPRSFFSTNHRGGVNARLHRLKGVQSRSSQRRERGRCMSGGRAASRAVPSNFRDFDWPFWVDDGDS